MQKKIHLNQLQYRTAHRVGWLFSAMCMWGLFTLVPVSASEPIRVGLDPAWPPFSSWSADADAPEGIDVDIFLLLANALEQDVEFVRTDSWEDTWNGFLAGEIDVCLGTAYDRDRAEQALFTRPYLSFPVALITRFDGPFLIDFSSLQEQHIVVPAEHITARYVRERFPAAHITETPNARSALMMVAAGSAKLTIENIATASYIIRTSGLSNLKIAGVADLQFNLRYAVHPSQHALQEALNDLLKDFPETHTLQLILDRWIPVDYQRAIRWQSVQRAVLTLLAFVIPVILAILIWNRRMARELEVRRRIEQNLLSKTDELNTVNKQLRETQESKDLLMRMAAHDLNNPLATIVLSAEFLKDEAHKPDPKIEQIINAAERMSRMVRNLLHFEAIEHGAGWIREQQVDPVKIIQRVAGRYVLVARNKGIALIQKTLIDRELIITADEEALDQIIDNLLSNAFKYTPSDCCIYVDMTFADGKFRVSIRDEGLGIPEDTRARLFTPYFRTANRPTAGEKSNGLGLAVVKHLVEKMNGRVWYEAAPEGGSMFIVEFPVLTDVAGA